MVRTPGIEPGWIAPRDFKSLASTGSATSANQPLASGFAAACEAASLSGIRLTPCSVKQGAQGVKESAILAGWMDDLLVWSAGERVLCGRSGGERRVACAM